MPATFAIGGAWIAASVAAIVFEIALPVVLAVVAHKRLQVSWRYFGFGALIFFLFQLISRVPLVEVGGVVLHKQLLASRTLLIIWSLLLVLTAGIFEEVGRYLGYRWFLRREEKTWSKAVMYGLGHGGLESMVLVAGLSAITLLNVLVLSSLGLGMLPAAQRATAAKQLAAIAAQPGWTPLIGGYERIWALAIQVALSVIVLQVFRRGSLRWFWLAMAAHWLVDGVSVFVPMALGNERHGVILTEGILTVFGLAAIWVIWRLREGPVAEAISSERQPAAQGMIV